MNVSAAEASAPQCREKRQIHNFFPQERRDTGDLR